MCWYAIGKRQYENSNVSKYKREEFRLLLEKKFNIKISTDSLRRYLNRKNIKDRYVDYAIHNVRKDSVYKCPVGTEKVVEDGVFIKVAQPDKWRRKTRVMYEKYHNCKLKDDEYIVFLNQDRNDFSKDNLIKSSRKEIAYLHNNKTFSKNPKLTELGILSAKLMIKAKEMGV